MAGLLSLSLGGAYACGLQARFPRRPGILLENQLMTPGGGRKTASSGDRELPDMRLTALPRASRLVLGLPGTQARPKALRSIRPLPRRCHSCPMAARHPGVTRAVRDS